MIANQASILHTLVPRYIYQQYQLGNLQGELEAITLFMDISGFTPMTQALMQHDKEGAEVMVSVINQVFAPIIDEVYERGGFVTSFGGDALTVVFPQCNTPTAQAACLTAWKIQQIFQEQDEQTTQFGDFGLAVKMGLSAGKVTWGIIGPPHHKTYFFQGDAIDCCTQAEQEAQEGDIVLDPHIQALLPDKMYQPFSDSSTYAYLHPIHTVGTGENRTATLPLLNIQLLYQFFAQNLWQMSQQGEFREVATVFISFQETLTQPELHQFVTQVIQTTDSFGGYFNKLGFGDKGGTLLVFFGAPVGYENNMERALSFTLALQQQTQLSEMPASLVWRAGVTVGTIYAGFVGIPKRDEYTAIGNMVNLASRLMSAAPWGQIWVSGKVILHRTFHFESIGNKRYKGFTHPILTYQLLGEKTTDEKQFSQQKMVGRQAELNRLVELTQPLFAGKSAGMTIIYGEPGIGKSRLSFALRETLKDKVSWFTGQTDQTLQQAFNPFIYWLKYYFNQTANATYAGNQAHFTRRLGQLLSRLESIPQSDTLIHELVRTQSILGALLRIHWTNSLYEQLDASLRYKNTLFAIKNLLLAESRLRPVVFELEDAHWLDAASVEMLATLSRNIEAYPLMIIITSRYADDGSQPHFNLPADLPIQTIELKSLSFPALRQQVENILGGKMTNDFLNLLYEKTEANPLFVKQVLHYFQENDLLTQVKDEQTGTMKWTMKTQTFALPTTINAILVARIDRLAQQVKEVVQTAAVLGREFDVPILLQMLQEDALPAIHEAQQKQIWLTLNDSQFTFQNALLRDAAYEMQLRVRLKTLHQLAARTYEKLFANDLSSHYADLVYHYRQAENYEREQHYIQLLGKQSVNEGAQALAVSYFSRALQLTLPTDQEVCYHLLLERVQAYNRLGERDAQANDLQELAHLAQELNSVEKQAYIALQRSQYALDINNYEAVLEAVADVYECVDAGNPWAIEARILQGRAFIAKSDYERAYKHLTVALNQATTIEAREVEAQAHRVLGIVLYYQSNYDQAEIHWQKALAEYQSSQNKWGEAATLNNLGLVANARGNFTQAQTYYGRALKRRKEIGDRFGESNTLMSLGNLAGAYGNLTKSQEYYTQALAIDQDIGNRLGESSNLSNLGNVARDQGDFKQAQSYYQKALDLKEAVGDQRGKGLALSNLGIVAYYQNDLPQAEQYLSQALIIRESIGDKRGMGLTLNTLGLVTLKMNELDQAQHYFELALDIHNSVGQQHHSVEDQAGLAHVLLARGDLKAARAQIEPVLSYLAKNSKLRGVEHPFQVFATCIHILQAMKQFEKAQLILTTAYLSLQAQAHKLDDNQRQMFLDNVPAHHEIVQLWEQHQNEPQNEEDE